MILNRQHRVRVAVGDLKRFLARANRILRIPAGSLTICLVTDTEIARWNHAHRGKQGPTDVLSFPPEPEQAKNGKHGVRKTKSKSAARARAHSDVFSNPDASAAAYLGDIAIAPAVAVRNARRFGRTLDAEMRILILHGMLHLIGYDHETDTGQMDRREKRLRRALGLG